jgi:hypothetical protein
LELGQVIQNQVYQLWQELSTWLKKFENLVLSDRRMKLAFIAGGISQEKWIALQAHYRFFHKLLPGDVSLGPPYQTRIDAVGSQRFAFSQKPSFRPENIWQPFFEYTQWAEKTVHILYAHIFLSY